MFLALTLCIYNGFPASSWCWQRLVEMRSHLYPSPTYQSIVQEAQQRVSMSPNNFDACHTLRITELALATSPTPPLPIPCLSSECSHKLRENFRSAIFNHRWFHNWNKFIQEPHEKQESQFTKERETTHSVTLLSTTISRVSRKTTLNCPSCDIFLVFDSPCTVPSNINHLSLCIFCHSSPRFLTRFHYPLLICSWSVAF